ncbi:MAG TPA: hypothetical protein VK963_02805, partial [Candidatus Saccharimonadales bacterium]|nr:hypothetical protein [Candidatus Saccharimonadales bacterium]
NNVGLYTSIAIGTDGLPVISYRDITATDLAITECGNAACSSGNTTTKIPDPNAVGNSTSIAIGTDGLPIISHRDSTATDLAITKCGNAACSAASGSALTGGVTLGTTTSAFKSIYFDTLNFGRKDARVSLNDQGNFFANNLFSGNTGNVGIGTTGPGSRLDIYQGTATSNTNLLRILSDVGGAGNVKLRVDSDGDLFLDGNITAASTTITAGAADVAEEYNVTDDAQPGDIVMAQGGINVGKSQGTYQRAILGVVSTSPGLTLSLRDQNGTATTANPKPIALVGRVPVKVSGENGAIAVGDPLTSSSVPGMAMKATAPGMIIGRALEPFSGERGVIEVFVTTSYYSPTDGSEMQGASSGGLQNGDEASFASLNVSGATTLASLTVTGDAVFEGTVTVSGTAAFQGNIIVAGHIIGSGNTPGISVNSQQPVGSLETAVEGTDTAGTIKISSVGAATTGHLATVTFSKPYGKIPRIILTATNADGLKLPVYLEKTTEGFKVITDTAPVSGTTYQYDYVVIE